jgi:hypothetical protein
MEALYIIGIILIISGFISWAWVQGIDRAMRDFPDYKGEDLFDEVPKKKEQWDDNKQHTEQNFKI